MSNPVKKAQDGLWRSAVGRMREPAVAAGRRLRLSPSGVFGLWLLLLRASGRHGLPNRLFELRDALIEGSSHVQDRRLADPALELL